LTRGPVSMLNGSKISREEKKNKKGSATQIKKHTDQKTSEAQIQQDPTQKTTARKQREGFQTRAY